MNAPSPVDTMPDDDYQESNSPLSADPGLWRVETPNVMRAQPETPGFSGEAEVTPAEKPVETLNVENPEAGEAVTGSDPLATDVELEERVLREPSPASAHKKKTKRRQEKEGIVEEEAVEPPMKKAKIAKAPMLKRPSGKASSSVGSSSVIQLTGMKVAVHKKSAMKRPVLEVAKLTPMKVAVHKKPAMKEAAMKVNKPPAMKVAVMAMKLALSKKLMKAQAKAKTKARTKARTKP
eukprot:gnl/MRDRNA2_/MRDRNA2_29269_c0_seq1.p1 gnl/MRDRNA2_/MRDRNA2_29269_c0~~gnl/MRDRNA2_/MRDRNA2_29269_c0_seq1.p1  ORF type:complete len:236 (+),score=57.31 gnl/MRDRNA2_/MRDRNA2_29269_c0_seq1:108-815(+)